MKKIVIVTDRTRIADKMKEDLQYVLRDKVQTESCTLEQAESLAWIDGDLLLFTLGNRIDQVKDKIRRPEHILIVRRTIKEENFLKLFEIPQNTEVLVVNDNYENTLQTVALLYDLNVDHIHLHPYKEGDYDPGITVAITPGEVEKVPAHIKKIIDIGDRCLDLSTFLEIIYRLQINDDDISKRLLDYVNSTVSSNEGIHKYYKDAITKNMQMEQVLEMSEQGILMTLPDGEIVLCNQRIRPLTGLPVGEGISNIQQVFDPPTLEVLNREKLDDVQLKINGKDIVVKKNRIIYEEGIYQDLYFFKDITYVKSLEQTVTGQIKSSGFVAKYSLQDIIYHSASMKKCIASMKIFANTDMTILILGESGTGKELFAQSIHNLSPCRTKPFVAVNCAAVPANLLESELFGYVKGAFTGAVKEGKTGLFEHGNNGTIFLDEIGDMPYELQSRLLRVIQEKQIMRVGSDKVIDVNVRIIAATNKNLQQEVEAGRFRKDLYYRLGVLPITVPPLRERKEDIIEIFKSFLSKPLTVPVWVEAILLEYQWPGNVRELRNVAQYYELMADHENCLPEYLFCKVNPETVRQEKTEKDHILSLLAHQDSGGRSMGRERLKQQLEKEYGITISEYRLRELMEQLEGEGLIRKHTGRRGTVLTEQGRAYLARK